MTYSTLDLPDEPSRDEAAPQKFRRFFATVLADIRRGFAVRKVRRQLHVLPDHVLKDLGISRCDSDYLAAHGESAVHMVAGRAPTGRPSA